MSAARSREDASPTPLREVVGTALEEFVDLNGQPPDRVSGVRRSDSGFSILVDVVDVERIPSTTSVLSTYRVDADSDGHVVGYERIRRFTRASTDDR